VVVIVSVGSLVVTLNAKLLGGRVYVSSNAREENNAYAANLRSLFQSLCVLGYCIFPLGSFLAALDNVVSQNYSFGSYYLDFHPSALY
jgi:hypothetical protein